MYPTPTSTASSCASAPRSTATSSSATCAASWRRRVPPAAPAERLVRAAPRADAARGRALRRTEQPPAAPAGPHRPHRCAPACTTRRLGHFTTRQNLQFNWIPLARSADVMDLLAEVDMHGIQTSGNCIRNITSDALAGIAPTRSSTRAPTARSCASGARCTPSSPSCRASSRSPSPAPREDRAAIAWHDIGLQLLRNAPARSASRCWWAAAWAARR
jgi:hypothetical protein